MSSSHTTPKNSRGPQEPPEQVEGGQHVVAFTARVQAPAREIFALVADPHRHHEFDGSGTVQSRAVGPHRLRRGDRFSVHMKVFGVPYRLPLRVSAAEPPAEGRPGILEWVQPTGHRWRWALEPVTDDPGHTQVTEAYDARSQNRVLRRVLALTQVYSRNGQAIQASLSRLQELFDHGSGQRSAQSADRP